VTAERPEGLPSALWDRVGAFVNGTSQETAEPLVEAFVAWAEGRHPDRLEDLLDALRTLGAYPISLGVLEAAWNSDLPPERMGRVVEDWIGTVKIGLNDPKGAETVARHIAKDAPRHGNAFVGDLGHLLLGWEMYDIAAPLVERAAQAMPGDLSVQFNWGVIQKMRCDWAGARTSFEQVLRHRDDNQAARWNLGIACTALGDWPGARAAWSGLGMTLPEGDGDFAGEEGETTALRLPFPGENDDVRYEIVWGRRLGPARVRLRTIPRFSSAAAYGDVVLVDGVTVGETRLNGENTPIFPVLTALESADATVIVFRETDPLSAATDRVGHLAHQLNQEGWPAANWSNMVPGDGLCLALAVETGRSVEDARERVMVLSEPLRLKWKSASTDSA